MWILSMTSSLVRCFAAIELSDEVRAGAAGFIRDLSPKVPGVKWVEPENLHLTLKFLGEIPAHRVQDAAAALQRAAAGIRTFRLRFRGFGAFPSSNRARVLWIGLEEGGTGLAGFWARVEEEMEAAGFSREKRKFSAHLTLGRAREEQGVGVSGLVNSERPDLGTIEVFGATLFSSLLTPRGPIYKALEQVSLVKA